MISELKSFITEKNSELSSFEADLTSRKDDCFHLESKNLDISLSYDKLLAKFDTYHKSTEESKFEAITDAYKLGYLNCTNESALLYTIEDEDINPFYLDLIHVQSGQVNVAGTK